MGTVGLVGIALLSGLPLPGGLLAFQTMDRGKQRKQEANDEGPLSPE